MKTDKADCPCVVDISPLSAGAASVRIKCLLVETYQKSQRFSGGAPWAVCQYTDHVSLTTCTLTDLNMGRVKTLPMYSECRTHSEPNMMNYTPFESSKPRDSSTANHFRMPICSHVIVVDMLH